MVVAIDFGTSRSGYAYAYYNVPNTITTSTWSSSDQSKTLTAILLKKDDLSTIAFGTEAKIRYTSDPDNINTTLYF